MSQSQRDRRRFFGAHLTPAEVFQSFILPQIRDKLYDFLWVDLFAGEGNLILPILEAIPIEQRAHFFSEHIFLTDIQKEMVDACISRAIALGVPMEIARRNIRQVDAILHYPREVSGAALPVFCVTNPPYLYIGYAMKHAETRRKCQRYFAGGNSGYQDLYQLALMNDLRNGITQMIYIIPTNFLFGAAISNKIRRDFLPYYSIRSAVIFEKRIFEFTSTNTAILRFERNPEPTLAPVEFEGVKYGREERVRHYILKREHDYRGGCEFDDFVAANKAPTPLEVEYYLMASSVRANAGNKVIQVIDANRYLGSSYAKEVIHVNGSLHERILRNPLFIRTADTGAHEGRAGLYSIRETFGVDGVLTSTQYRTHPIQVFFKPTLPSSDVDLVRRTFNALLEHFRGVSDSEFMSTYKYSVSAYTRKYLGLNQARRLLRTIPILNMPPLQKRKLKRALDDGNTREVLALITSSHG